MTTYRVTLVDGQTFLMQADLEQSAAPIRADFHGELDSWQSTPFQTADANHDPNHAASLVARQFAVDDDDCVTVQTVEAVTD